MTQTVLIIGATRGIGAELAKRYVAQGDRVIATKRSAPAVIQGVDWITLDVTDHASVSALPSTIPSDEIDLMIVNAGVYLDKGQTIETGFGPQIWQETFAANVAGPFLVIQAMLPILKSGNPTRVAVLSSRMGSNANAGGQSYAYRSSKAAVTNLVSNLAFDLTDDGIAFGAYHPGWVRTDMGGDDAAIDVATSAAGLMERFAALSAKTSGCFEMYDGTALEF